MDVTQTINYLIERTDRNILDIIAQYAVSNDYISVPIYQCDKYGGIICDYDVVYPSASIIKWLFKHVISKKDRFQNPTEWFIKLIDGKDLMNYYLKDLVLGKWNKKYFIINHSKF